MSTKKKKPSRLTRAFRWYVLGYYHCDKCPFCWAEHPYYGDGDAGCYIYGDLRDSCRLLPPLRFLVGWPKKKIRDYREEHFYDDLVEEESELKRSFPYFRDAIFDVLKGKELRVIEDGEWKAIGPDDVYFQCELEQALRDYERNAHPQEYLSSRQEWQAIWKQAWNALKKPFLPFLPQKRASKTQPDYQLPF